VSAPQNKYAEELLSDLVNVFEQTLTRRSIDAGAAHDAACEATEEFRRRWGGLIVYIPKGRESEIDRRNLEIWQRFNGHNHNDLAREYDLTTQKIYAIVKRVKRAQTRLRQRDIFDAEAGQG